MVLENHRISMKYLDSEADSYSPRKICLELYFACRILKQNILFLDVGIFNFFTKSFLNKSLINCSFEPKIGLYIQRNLGSFRFALIYL